MTIRAVVLGCLAWCSSLTGFGLLSAATIDIAQGDRVPEKLSGSWFRLSDGTQVSMTTDGVIDLAPGVYTATPHVIFVRPPQRSDPGAWAWAHVGQRTLIASEVDQRQDFGRQRAAFDHLTLTIASWRLADDLDWPWVEYVDNWQGLPWICERLNPTTAGFAFDPQQGVYVDQQGQPIRLAPGPGGAATQLWFGDLVTTAPGMDDFPTIGILADDRGTPGVLDPEDILVTAQVPGGAGALADAVRLELVGHLHGPEPVHLFRRDWQRALNVLQKSGDRPIDPDNPIWGLPRWRQLLALAGMVIVIVVLLRNIRKYKKQRR